MTQHQPTAEAEAAEPTIDSPPASAPSRTAPLWAFPLVGAAGAVLGLLPWLLTGGRMPSQNLWSAIPADVPVTLLPLHPYAAGLLVALLVVGAAAAGTTARALGARRRRGATWLLLAGVFVVQLGAIVQTTVTTRATLPDGRDADLYTAAMTIGTVVVAAAGAGVAALVARAPRAGAVIGLAIGAVSAGTWLSGIVVPFGSVVTEYPPVLAIVPWVAPVLAGAAIAWAGLGTPGRIAAAVGTVAIVWIAPAILTGLFNGLGSRVYWRDPAAMAEVAVQVFWTALLIPELAWRPIAACVAVATIGLGLRALIARSRRSRSGV